VATKMSKAERISVSESDLADVSIEDIISPYEELLNALTEFNDARGEAEEALSNALGYHEEREWESRNDSLNEAVEALDRMKEAFDNIDGDWHRIDDDRMTTLRLVMDRVEENLGVLVEA